MLVWPKLGLVGLVLVVAVGCTSKAGPALMDDGSPTADSGYIQQGTTGGDAADTFNIRNHVGADGASPAILMSPPDAVAASQPVAAAPVSTPVTQRPATTAVAKPVSTAPSSTASAKPASAQGRAQAVKTGGEAPKPPVMPAAKPTGTKV